MFWEARIDRQAVRDTEFDAPRNEYILRSKGPRIEWYEDPDHTVLLFQQDGGKHPGRLRLEFLPQDVRFVMSALLMQQPEEARLPLLHDLIVEHDAALSRGAPSHGVSGESRDGRQRT